MTQLIPVAPIPDRYRIVSVREGRMLRVLLQRRTSIPFLWRTLETAVEYADRADADWLRAITERMAASASAD